LRFTSSYKPQSDPAERANQQVLEALREAVDTAAQYDKWNDALPNVTSRLNTHMSVTTKVSLVEFAHGFRACVPLTIELPDPATSTDEITD